MTCEACGTKLPPQKMGAPRKYCAPVDGVHECRRLAEVIRRLEKALEPINARLAAGDARDKLSLVELRYRLFTLLADEVDRPRHAPRTLARGSEIMTSSQLARSVANVGLNQWLVSNPDGTPLCALSVEVEDDEDPADLAFAAYLWAGWEPYGGRFIKRRM